MRILPFTRSPYADGLTGELYVIPVSSRRRRLGAACGAALLLGGLGVAATAGPAHASPTINWNCVNGELLLPAGRLIASDCAGAGSSDVYVNVGVLDQAGGPEDENATLFCVAFGGPNMVTGNWSGTTCFVYSG